MDNVELLIEKCREEAVIPSYAHDGDAGMDLYSCADLVVEPGKTVLVPVGIKLAIPYGYEVQIRPRSGISLKTMLRIPNTPGTIDCGYRDEVNVIIHNASNPVLCTQDEPYNLDVKGAPHGAYHIRKGDRIAQMVLSKVTYADFKVVSDVSEYGSDRGGGFGSSGIQ